MSSATRKKYPQLAPKTPDPKAKGAFDFSRDLAFGQAAADFWAGKRKAEPEAAVLAPKKEKETEEERKRRVLAEGRNSRALGDPTTASLASKSLLG